jgi:hypothetical protein
MKTTNYTYKNENKCVGVYQREGPLPLPTHSTRRLQRALLDINRKKSFNSTSKWEITENCLQSLRNKGSNQNNNQPIQPTHFTMLVSLLFMITSFKL